ncbi:MAG: hypothetical protein WCR71_06625 [Bacteroidales bacterium]
MKKSIFLPVILCFVGVLAVGQTTDSLTKLQKAESFRKGYHFNEAIALYKEILSESNDSLFHLEIYSLIAESENGINMLQYATRPTVTGKINLPVKDFFLYYPGNQYWAVVPDSVIAQLSANNGSPLSTKPLLKTNKYLSNNILFTRDSVNLLYFSAPNKNGNFDIYKTHQVDGTVWSHPEPLGDLINSNRDEIFPILSQDGKQLFFSSNGHFGMGGFDLYVSDWNEKTKEWDLPQNMGFPYSSVEDDILLINSEDGLHTYFASNRNTTSADSITLYRLDYESNPIRRALSSIKEASKLAKLNIREKNSRKQLVVKREVMTTPETDEYTKIIMEVKKIQKNIDSLSKEITTSRKLYNTLLDPADRALLEKKISEAEFALIDMQSLLRSANEVAQKREMDFLSRGTLIPRREDFTVDSNEISDSIAAAEHFSVSKSNFNPFPNITLLEPIELFDYTFKVDKESVMALDHTIPDGLIYRIQLFAVVSKNTKLSTFKGLRPIFEGKNSAGRWIYYAGQFNNYQAASNALTMARRSGFPSSILVAFNNRKSISIKNARSLEKEQIGEMTFQIKVAGYPAGIPQPVLELIRENTDKDIAKKVVEGRDIYYIGPFNIKQEAEQIMFLLNSIGSEEITIIETEITPEENS